MWAIQADSSASPRKFEEPWAEAIDFVRRTDSSGRRKVIILEVQTWPALGNYEQVLPVHRAIRAAIADGCVVCVAAGNGNRPADRNDFGEPFDPTGSILVGATAYHASENKRAPFSNYGGRIVVSAPGDPVHDVTCAQSSDIAYRNGFGGTSGATPKVAGVVALMLSVNPTLKHEEIQGILAGTGTSLTEDPGKPIGVFLNAEAAVAEAFRHRGETALVEPVIVPKNRAEREEAVVGLPQDEPHRTGPLVLPDDIRRRPISWASKSRSGSRAAAAAAVRKVERPLAGVTPPDNDKTLRMFRESVEGTLTQQDRILIVEQAIETLEGFYVHRPLKEAIHAVRPTQRLRVLLRHLQQKADIPAEEKDELTFHNKVTEIFNSVRDLHTIYELPIPYRYYTAYLPFEVAHFYDGDTRKYLVTRVKRDYEFAHPDFEPGSELVYWNGMPIERAVLRNSDQTAGSNEAARHARGISSLTIRSMDTALPPNADFVDIEFLPPGAGPGSFLPMRQHWFVSYTPPDEFAAAGITATALATVSPTPTVSPSQQAAHDSLNLGPQGIARKSEILFEKGTTSRRIATEIDPVPPDPIAATDIRLAAFLGLDTAAEAVRKARQRIFDPNWRQSAGGTKAGDEVNGLRGSASPGTVADTIGGTEFPVTSPWHMVFRAREFDMGGKLYGHIQITSFDVRDPDGFVGEFVRLAEKMPSNGLILDVRGNGGGLIWAAERLLQTFSPVQIAPEPMQFLVTPGTVDLCRNNPSTSRVPLNRWRSSLEEAVETSAVYSHAFPLTDESTCNAIGQRYYGPVVLLIDGNCYSATDMFAAGFQDHGLGQVIGVSASTGAGGANVWEHRLLTEMLPVGWGLKLLPKQASMRVAIRQSLRVGPKAGALLEDFGVIPDQHYKLQRGDLMEGDRGLFAFAAAVLSKERPRIIRITPEARADRISKKSQITIETAGLDRLDFFLDGRPQASIDLAPDELGKAVLHPQIDRGTTLRLLGYHVEVAQRQRPAALCLKVV